VASALAALLNQWVWRQRGKRFLLIQVIAYLPSFLWRSLLGGLDVAVRILHPAMPIRPAFVSHRCTEDDAIARTVFCDVISLMPGTLSTGRDGEVAQVHLLFDTPGVRGEMEAEEARVRKIFAENRRAKA